MSYIPEVIKQAIYKRARNCCEYCQTQRIIVVNMEIDHVIPIKNGGETILENLCLACINCNDHKLAATVAIDPETNQAVTLYNPRIDAWADHFQWDNSCVVLLGKTATGRATIERLKINDIDMILSRKVWVAAGWHPPKFDEK